MTCVKDVEMVRTMEKTDLVKVLGRDEHLALIDIKKDSFFKDKKILITGASVPSVWPTNMPLLITF